jgi:hypothetical protein
MTNGHYLCSDQQPLSDRYETINATSSRACAYFFSWLLVYPDWQ